MQFSKFQNALSIYLPNFKWKYNRNRHR